MYDINEYGSFQNSDIEAIWRDLFSASGAAPMASFEWNSLWWRHLGGGKRNLQLITLWQGSKCVGLIPFMTEQRFGLRHLRFVGAGLTDYHEALCHPGVDPAQLCRAALDHISAGKGIDLMNLEQVPDNSQTLRGFGEPEGFSRRLITECPQVVIGKLSWEQYLSRVKKKVRNNWSYRVRQLEHLGSLELRELDQCDELTKALPALFDMHVDRWASAGNPSKFRFPQVRTFVTQACCALDAMRVFALELEGKPIGYRIGFYDGKRYSDWSSAFDPSYMRYSISTVIIGKIIERLSRRGLERYDFMRGNYRFKRDWMIDDSFIRNYQLLKPVTPLRGRLAHAYYMDWKWKAKARLQPVLTNFQIQALLHKKAV